MDKPKNNLPRIPRVPAVETLGPIDRAKKSRLRAKILIPAASLVLLVAAGTAYIAKSPNSKYAQNLNSQLAAKDTQEINSLNSASNAENIEPKTSEAKKVQEQEQPRQKNPTSQPIVVFEPEGIFTEKEKQDLMRKLVEPMVDYQPGVHLAIHIEVYSQDKFVGGATDSKYIVTTIGNQDQGGTGGFLFGSKKKGLDWWQPECLEACVFSPEFTSKYPEVAKNYQP